MAYGGCGYQWNEWAWWITARRHGSSFVCLAILVSRSRPDMATIREENCSLSRTSRHLAVVTASGSRKNKLSMQRHSSVPMLSFDTEVEELNIATRADTMMTALSPPSSYSITNGRVWYQRLFPHQTTLRPPFINCLYCWKLLLLQRHAWKPQGEGDNFRKNVRTTLRNHGSDVSH